MDAVEVVWKVAHRALKEAGVPLSDDQMRALIDVQEVDAAFAAAFTRIDDEALYPSPAKQAAILTIRLIESLHLPLGLERSVALLIADIRLQNAGLELQARASEIDRVFAAVAERRVSDDALIRWFERRIGPLRALS